MQIHLELHEHVNTQTFGFAKASGIWMSWGSWWELVCEFLKPRMNKLYASLPCIRLQHWFAI